MNYFDKFPLVKYDNNIVVDITRRAKIMESLRSKPYLFLPYTVDNDDRAEDISFYYYGTVDYTWLVYMANDIIDPYTQWPMTSAQFDRFIINKYKDQANTVGYDVVAWTQNTNITTNIVHYRNVSDSTQIVSKDTYDLAALNPDFSVSDWEAIRYYDYEFEQNESKRNIQLVNNSYVSDIDAELERVLNE